MRCTTLYYISSDSADMHHQPPGISRQGNICLWNPEFAVRRTIRYRAQDVPVRPRDALESPAESIEEFLTFNKFRLEPGQFTYDNLKSFLEKVGESREPSAIPMSLPELRKLALVDDR